MPTKTNQTDVCCGGNTDCCPEAVAETPKLEESPLVMVGADDAEGCCGGSTGCC